MKYMWTFAGIGIFAVLVIVVIGGCLEEENKEDGQRKNITSNEKLGIFVTPDIEDGSGIWPVSYSNALSKAKEGGFGTVWILAQWKDVEKSDDDYEWSIMDARINNAIKNNFSVGVRTLIITTGNDENAKFVSELTMPSDVNQDMSSEEFKQRAVKFYTALTSRYKGRIKYIAVGNSVNDYFEHHPLQWEGFKKAYPVIVDAIHGIDPEIFVMSDLNYGESFYSDKSKMQKYLDYFGSSNDDAFGFIFYFIDPVYYGDFKNFNKERLGAVFNEMRQRVGNKKVYILETACFSKNPNNGDDLTNVQSDYVGMLLATAQQNDFIIGVSWFTLYDAKDLPFVPFDAKSGLGLFDSNGNPKKAWETWKTHAG